jgi:hypothetical protein
MDMADPEVEGELEFDLTTQTVTGTVQITRTCAECGTTLKEAQLEMESELTGDAAKLLEAHLQTHGEYAKAHDGTEMGEFEVNEDSVDSIEESGGRYKKSYFGATIHYTITCSCDKNFSVSGSMEDKVSASQMDEVA